MDLAPQASSNAWGALGGDLGFRCDVLVSNQPVRGSDRHMGRHRGTTTTGTSRHEYSVQGLRPTASIEGRLSETARQSDRIDCCDASTARSTQTGRENLIASRRRTGHAQSLHTMGATKNCPPGAADEKDIFLKMMVA